VPKAKGEGVGLLGSEEQHAAGSLFDDDGKVSEDIAA
jgi:hypothetical protein